MSDGEKDADRRPPLLRVVRGGDPTPDELAALVVALNSARPTPREPAVRRSAWADRRTLLRRRLDHGPGRWTAGARAAR